MNIKDIMKMEWKDLRGMGRRELSKLVSSLSSAANKRLRRFEEKGEVSPAVRYAEKGGKFSVAGKNLNQLRAEYIRAKTFLQQETGTLRKWEKTKTETVKTLSDMGVNIPKEDIGEVMKIYGKVKSEFPDLTDSSIYAPAIQDIYNKMQAGETASDIIASSRNMMMQGYENRERSNNAFESGRVSDYF